MIYCAKNKKIPEFTPLTINADTLKRTSHEKYLGLWLDDKLTWQVHISHIKTKLTAFLGALRKVANCIPYNTRTMIYNSLVKSHLVYLIEIWGSAAVTHLNSLQRVQNKIIKTLYHLHQLTSTNTVYKKTKFFNINQLYTYFTCILIKKITTNSIQSNIQLNRKTIKHNLRNKNKLELTQPRTNYGKRTILFEGAQLYNKLPDDLKDCDNINAFKRKLKEHISTQ